MQRIKQKLARFEQSHSGRRLQQYWQKFRSTGRRGMAAAMAALVLGSILPIVLFGQHVSASTMGPNSPATGTATGTVSGCSGGNWASAGNVTAQDSVYATTSAALASGACTTNYLEATNYGFTIPSTATINGVSVTIYRTGTQGSKNVIEDKQISLIVSGSIQTTNNATTTAWPTTNTAASYGGTSNTWGGGLTPTTVNATGFGVAIAAQNVHTSSGSSASETPSVDYVSVTITYTIPTTYNQAAYRWFQNSNSPTPVYPVSEHVSSSADTANSVAIDSTGGYMYIAGSDSTPGSSNTEWRLEKRSLATGALVSAFGTSGAISENVSAGNDTANSVAIDTSGGYMYVAGVDYSPGTGNPEWRIEKRNLSDGSFVSAFGTSGAVSEDISVNSDQADTIAIDPAGGYMYVGGWDSTPSSTNGEWRIEKRNLSDGSLVSAFGTSGAISEDISTNLDEINSLAIDPSGGNMYVAGWDSTPGSNNREWRLEKRSLSSGALVSAFGTSGAISEDISTGNDMPNSIAIDPVGGYMYVAGSDITPGNGELRLEKRNLSDGSFVSAFGTSGAVSENVSTGGDQANSIAIDAAGGYMYVAGADSTPGNAEWRLEKRSLSSGALVSAFGTSGAVSEDISTGSDMPFSIAIDTSGGNMYLAGWDSTPSNNEIRIEGRSLSSGSMITAAAPSPLAAANTAITTPAGAFRLRILLGVGSSNLSASGQTFQLMEAQMTSGTCATQTYSTAVTATSPIAFYTNSNIADGSNMSASSNDPTDGTNSNVAETYISSSTAFTNAQSAINAGQDGEWDISLYNYSASAGTTWCFEVQKNGGTALDTYTQYPQLTTSATSYTQAGYRWMQNSNAAPTNYPISEHISSSADYDQSVAIDSANGYMYDVGGDDGAGGNCEWRIEKRNLSDGSFVTAFGSSGSISEPLSSFGGCAQSIAIDSSGGYMYVAGFDYGSTYEQWRIEKRSLSTGALVSGFGTSGALDEQIGTSGNSVAESLAIDPTGGNMYLVGYDQNTTGNIGEWRIEKRSLSTGALVSGFGTSGAISEHISTNTDQANSIAIDPTGGNMYVVGYDSGSTSNTNEWRIEKRSLSTGALVSGFGTSGAISEQISTNNDQANSLAIDTSSGNMYIVGGDTNINWRIEKRSLSTGALVSGFGTSGAVSEQINPTYGAYANSVAIDTSGGNMYVVGMDENSTGNQGEWRIEKRSLSTGAFVSGFGTSGAISEDISTATDQAYSVAIDTTGGYMYAVGTDSNTSGANLEWRIEARSLTSGAMNTGGTVTPLAAINTPVSTLHNGDILRLRLLIGVGGSMIATSGQAFKLQVARTNSMCDNSLSYSDVGSTGAMIFYTGNSNLTDGSAMSASSNDPTDGYNTVAPQDYLASNTNFTNNQSAVRPTQDGEWDIALQVNSPGPSGYCFRVVTSTGSLLNTYNYFPELGVHALPKQRLRLGQTLVNGVNSGLDTVRP